MRSLNTLLRDYVPRPKELYPKLSDMVSKLIENDNLGLIMYISPSYNDGEDFKIDKFEKCGFSDFTSIVFISSANNSLSNERMCYT